MTRIFLAAGVAALAIASPAAAKPGGGNGGGHGGGGGNPAAHAGGGGGGHGGGQGGGGYAPTYAGGGGHGGGHGGGGYAPMYAGGGGHGGGHGGGGFAAPQMQRSFAAAGGGRGHGHGGGFAAPRMQRSFAFGPQGHGHGGAAMHAERGHGAAGGQARMAQRVERQQVHGNRAQQFGNRMVDRQQLRGNRAQEVRNQVLPQQLNPVQDRVAMRDQLRGAELARAQDFNDRFSNVNGRGLVNGCPPGLWNKNNGCLPPGQAMKLLGAPISDAGRIAELSALPAPLQYIYPDTPNYYYRYGDGYLYQVDRSNNIIDQLLPLIGGGYLPGMMFPSAYSGAYMPGYTFPTGYADPYVPDYYGWNSFYPDTPSMDYRYLNGNVYGVDPYSGMIEDVIPTYGYGYGVGQVLPASYGYYNVPYDYRSLYYNTPDYNYWYAPGAIYQVDPQSQLITAVASLLAPGLAIGQPLPMGYDMYNVPMDYRATYYDTPTAWYRYNNGNIYQVDPTTRLVTAVVASLLT